MTRSAIIALWLVVLASCLQTHSSGTVQIDDQTCVLCHKTDYDNTSSAASALQKIPDHAALGYGTNCTDCHVAQLNPAAWKLATNHPESTFSISSSSKHANIACTACHNVALVDPTIQCDWQSCHESRRRHGILNHVPVGTGTEHD